jgi:cytochrome c oxidase subunit II
VRTAASTLLCGAGVLALSGCGDGADTQNALNPQSHASRDIASLWWWMMGIAWGGLALVTILLVLAWVRARRRSVETYPAHDKPGERGAWTVVLGLGVVVPVILLSALFLVANLFVLPTTEAPKAAGSPLTVEVTGHMWWWEIRYPQSGAVTANELHIPVRTAVRLETRTADVIHSFWVPELNRKIDMIPEKRNAIVLEANRVGVYRGQCAEFCGLQHANMSMAVHVESAAAFRAWLAAQARPAAAPAAGLATRGRALFMSGTCASCHAIRGTQASGETGPDLTHLASRQTIGALTAPNSFADLAQWIERSQSIKPGNQMPNFDLPSADLTAIVTYLEGLK